MGDWSEFMYLQNSLSLRQSPEIVFDHVMLVAAVRLDTFA